MIVFRLALPFVLFLVGNWVGAKGDALGLPEQGAPCVGDENDDGVVTVDELVKGINIALADRREDWCGVFDADRSGRITIDELVLAVNAALNGCGVIENVDVSAFRQFHFYRTHGLGFCPPLGAVYAASVQTESDGGYVLDLSVLEEGQSGVDGCLPDLYPERSCAVARRQPPRYLSAEEVARMRALFSSVEIRNAPAATCRLCFFDPCLINVMDWDFPPGERDLFANDHICGSNRRADGKQTAAVIALLEELRRASSPTPSPTPTGAAVPACGDAVRDEEIGEECDDGNNLGGDGCAANCTVESRRTAMLDPERSFVVVQGVAGGLFLTLSGKQALRTGSPRDLVVRDPQGNVITQPGEIPVVIKAADVQLDPVRISGSVCACLRGVEAPQHGEGNSASGIIGCGPEGLTDIDYKLVQDHNTTPGDWGNGRGSCQLPNDPECDDSFTLPGCGTSTAWRDAGGHCISPREAEFFGGRQPPGSALIHSSIAIGLLRDGGLCLTGAAARNADGSCKFSDYGDDCTPCTEDDVDLDQPECVPSTTGSAAAALFDAGGPDAPIDADCAPDVIIFAGASDRLCTSSSQCSPGESCGQTCDTSGVGCENDDDCPPGDSCGRRRCQVLCSGSRCRTTARGARFDCEALAANPAGGLSGAALAGAFPSIGARTIVNNVTTFVLAFGSGSVTGSAAPPSSRRTVDSDP